MNLILTGMRGTGKSSIGVAVAELLGFTFVDTDVAIETLAGCRIAEIVATYGWEHFRALERQVVERVAAADRQVIAAGGGTLIDETNAARLKSTGLVVLLLCDLVILQQRISAGTNRPSLTGQGSAVAELTQVWEARRARYHAVADLTYDVSSETADYQHDVCDKAAGLVAMLRQSAAFHAVVADRG